MKFEPEGIVPKELQLALATIEKQYGKNSVFTGDILPEDVDAIPTNNFLLDLSLGVGGLPKSRIIEIFGPEAIGKTLISLSLVSQCQKAGGRVAYIDVECDLDPTWCKTLGVDMSKMYISQPENGEEALSIVETLTKTNAFDLIIVDSVAAMAPKAEVEGSMESNHVGLQARMMGQGLRKLRQPVSATNTCLVFVNQVRDKIGPMAMGGTTTPGGRALKFAASVRIELKRLGNLTNSDGENIGTKVRAIILKNKVFRPFISIDYHVLHGSGFDNTSMILDTAVEFGLVTKSGSWYKKADGTSLGQGANGVGSYFKENPDYYEELKTQAAKAYADAL